MKEGIKPYYAVAVQTPTVNDDSLSLQISTKQIRHRGDTLGGPVLNVDIFSPADNIVGVRITHFKQKRSPETPLFPNGAPPKPAVSTATTDAGISLTSGKLTATVKSNPYTLTFTAGEKTLTFAGPKYQGVSMRVLLVHLAEPYHGPTRHLRCSHQVDQRHRLQPIHPHNRLRFQPDPSSAANEGSLC